MLRRILRLRLGHLATDNGDVPACRTDPWTWSDALPPLLHPRVTSGCQGTPQHWGVVVRDQLTFGCSCFLSRHTIASTSRAPK